MTRDPRLCPSEFCITGTLKDWSIIDVLHKIENPTLIISSTEDEVLELRARGAAENAEVDPDLSPESDG